MSWQKNNREISLCLLYLRSSKFQFHASFKEYNVYHSWISHLHLLWFSGFVWFILSLKKKTYKYEDRQLRIVVYTEYYPITTLFAEHPKAIPIMAEQILTCEYKYCPFISLTDIDTLQQQVYMICSVRDIFFTVTWAPTTSCSKLLTESYTSY